MVDKIMCTGCISNTIKDEKIQFMHIGAVDQSTSSGLLVHAVSI